MGTAGMGTAGMKVEVGLESEGLGAKAVSRMMARVVWRARVRVLVVAVAVGRAIQRCVRGIRLGQGWSGIESW